MGSHGTYSTRAPVCVCVRGGGGHFCTYVGPLMRAVTCVCVCLCVWGVKIRRVRARVHSLPSRGHQPLLLRPLEHRRVPGGGLLCGCVRVCVGGACCGALRARACVGSAHAQGVRAFARVFVCLRVRVRRFGGEW